VASAPHSKATSHEDSKTSLDAMPTHDEDFDFMFEVSAEDDTMRVSLNTGEAMELLSQVTVLPETATLEEQQGRCAQCQTLIPVLDTSNSYEYARMCAFDGHWYCFSCHHNDTAVVPAYILMHADVKPRPVCLCVCVYLLARIYP
jgi:hypothetical protein